MVFAINTDQDTFAAFQLAAEASNAPSSSQPISPTQAGPTILRDPGGAATATGAQKTSISATARKPVPVAAVAGSVVAALVLLLCIVAFLVRRRRRASRNNAPRELGPRTESVLLELGDDNRTVDTRPQLLILYEKNTTPPVGSSSSSFGSSSSIPNSGSSSFLLPTAAELAVVNMEAEMRVLREQVQRLELDRQTSGTRTVEGELPPEYKLT
ncbi:hypothetical protein B0H17DRAFT_1207229 [Mycena rosella]|uniref:Uncharacterized protein n=1 Tax=Mycena rosella TaxID=1033263 RepID=A0AAD7GCM2_MYCRO|nr:hypothetical protein B0H17DRAFT_1207229 [Mycena rosella]